MMTNLPSAFRWYGMVWYGIVEFNYHPISNLTFISKLLERIVLNQLNVCLQQFNLLPGLQSAYRRCHSTETAMLKVLSDAFLAADTGQATLLGLLVSVLHLTLLTMPFSLRDLRLVWLTVHCTGRRRIWLVERSMSVTVVKCRPPDMYTAVYPRVWYSDPFSSCYM